MIPEVDYANETAKSIFDIISFYRRSSLDMDGTIAILKFSHIFGHDHVINNAINITLLKCGHILVMHSHPKFDNDIFVRFQI